MNIRLLKPVDAQVKIEKGGDPTIKSTVGRYEVDWKALEDAKVGDKPIFSVWREKYFSWLLGHSQTFIDQIRHEIATELAEEELGAISESKAPGEQIRNETIKKYDNELRNKGVSDLLKGESVDTRGWVSTRNKETFNTVFPTLNTKPHYGHWDTELIKDFLGSVAFIGCGGRTRLLTRYELGSAFINYLKQQSVLTREAIDNMFFLSDEYKSSGGGSRILGTLELQTAKLRYLDRRNQEIKAGFDEVLKSLNDEVSIINDLKKQYSTSMVSPEHKKERAKEIDKLVELWQRSTGYKKDVVNNEKDKGELEVFIKEAYQAGKAAVDKISSKMPRKPDESLRSYHNRLRIAIEKELKDNPAAKIAYLYNAAQMIEGTREERKAEIEAKIKSLLEKDKQRLGERETNYIRRVSEEMKKLFQSNDNQAQKIVEEKVGGLKVETLARKVEGSRREEIKAKIEAAFEEIWEKGDTEELDDAHYERISSELKGLFRPDDEEAQEIVDEYIENIKELPNFLGQDKEDFK